MFLWFLILHLTLMAVLFSRFLCGHINTGLQNCYREVCQRMILTVVLPIEKQLVMLRLPKPLKIGSELVTWLNR